MTGWTHRQGGVDNQFDDQSLECHLKYAMFTQKCHQNHQKMEYFENTLFYFFHVKSHANSLLNISGADPEKKIDSG